MGLCGLECGTTPRLREARPRACIIDTVCRSFPNEELLKRLTPSDVPEGYKDDKDDD